MATATMGMESVVADELKTLGYTDTKIENCKVEFTGTLLDICRCNMWLRTSDRLLLKIGEFKATTFDELFEKTKALPWANYIAKDNEFPVSRVSSVKSKLFSKSDCQSIVKKAVVDSLKKSHNVQTLPETGALFSLRIQIVRDIVTLSIDTSGSGLNKRGYREHMDLAPIKETLAAGLILLSRWKGGDRVLMDPMCGTGTFLIEAAMIAKNIAPGLNRDFASKHWSFISKDLWESAYEEAKELEKRDNKYLIYGSDGSWKALKIARENIAKAGFDDIYVQKLQLEDINSKYKNGVIITNPPYGERMQTKEQAEELYKLMGTTFREQFPEWSYYVITSYLGFEKHFKMQSNKKRKLYNGGILCWYYQYFGTNFKKTFNQRNKK